MTHSHPAPIKYKKHLIYDVSKFPPVDANKFEVCASDNEHLFYAISLQAAKDKIDKQIK